MIWIILFAASAVAGVIQTVTGFGSAILLMMVLPYFFNMLQAPALTSSITLGLTAALAWKFRDSINFRLVLLPIVCYEIGSITVLSIASRLNLDVLSIAFGVFLILISLYFLLLSSSFSVQATMASASVCALISGVCSGLFGIGGPPLALYFLAATREKKAYVANVQFVFAVTTVINLVIRIQKGFYTLDLLPLTLLGMAGINLGKLLGLQILERIDTDMMKKLVYILVGIAGILTLLGV